ncbi:MAG: NAD-dependent epimerase/dehydratase [Saprospiraceae bacterium]|nr:NAD-dependent epimerase/dehydratase [Saprospiraceae bacterium]
MRILITGGAGYVGYSLVKKLIEDADAVHSVTIYDNLSRKNYSFFTEAQFNHKPIKLIHRDILDGRSLVKALENIDCVIHLAAKVTTPYSDTEAHLFDQVNHWGTAHLADILEDSPVKKVIYLSSISVYGNSVAPVDESSPTNPMSFYGISKLNGEKQINRLSENKNVYILRSANVYGYNPSYRIDAVINRFLFQANFLGRITLNGRGDQYRSFIHVNKLASAIRDVIDIDLPTGIYNIAEHNMMIKEVAEQIASLYPSLEMLQSNLNMPMRNISTILPGKIFDYISLADISFETELQNFKSQFSF